MARIAIPRRLGLKPIDARLSYGYKVVGIVALLMALLIGAQSSFGVFFKPMLAEFGWTRAVTSGPYSISVIVTGVLGIVAGKLSDRLGPRRVIAAGGVLYGLGFILMYRMTGLVELYLLYGVLMATGSGLILVPAIATVSRWFVKRRGLMTGIALSGMGVGVAVVPPIISQLILSYGWRVPLLVLGIVSLVSIVILAGFLRSEPPVGEEPELKAADGPPAHRSELSLGEALRTRQFWFLSIAWFLYGFYWQVGTVHTVPHATDIGMTPTAAAAVLTVIGVLGILGRTTIGFAGDRFGTRAIVTAGFVLLSASFWGLALFNGTWTLYAYAVIFGLLSGIGILLSPILARVFGLKALGAIFGVVLFINSLGGALGPTIAGHMFDTMSTYRWAFALCGACGLTGAIVFCFSDTSRALAPRRYKAREQTRPPNGI